VTPTTVAETRGEHWVVRRSCPECAVDVVWVADATPATDLLALHRRVCHGSPARGY